MKKLICLTCLLAGCASTKKVTWTDGEVPVAYGDEYFHNVGWLEDKELGLRADGVLVWRKKQAAKPAKSESDGKK